MQAEQTQPPVPRRDPAMGEARRRITRFTYDEGPMQFLAEQICKEMQRVGYPAVIHCVYRAPEVQEKYRRTGTSKAGPFQSAHQYYAAADIIHERWAWFAAPDAPDGAGFWRALGDATHLVSEKFGVPFNKRLSWDLAHVELFNWREMKEIVGPQEPSKLALDWYFQVTLPSVWRRHHR